MRVELHINDNLQIQLKPETAMEKALLSEMLAASGKGKSVSLFPCSFTECDGAIVSVEK